MTHRRNYLAILARVDGSFHYPPRCLSNVEWRNHEVLVGLLAVVLCFLGTGFGQKSDNSVLSLSIPFEFTNNQILVKIGINGSEPTWFVLDSGASAYIVDTSLARKLGLKTEGEKQGTGAGTGTVKYALVKGITYNLPSVDMSIDESYVIDLSGQPALQGRYIGGILGYSFFAPYVVDVDFDARLMTIYGWEQYHSDAESIPFRLVKHTPYIQAKIAVAGRPPMDLEALVDSGSQDAIDADLLAQSPQRLEVVGGVGLGQEFRTVLGRADSVQVGSFTLPHPFGATGGVALIGNEIWRRFHVAFDYPHGRIFLSPGQHFSDPFLLDASGLDLRWTPGFVSFDIHDVGKDSPAWVAGIRPNDEIIMINGQPASAFTMEQISHLLTEAGREIRFTVKRGTTTQDIKVRLRSRW